MLLPTVPAIVLLQKQYVLAPTARAGHTVWPSARYQILTAVDWIGEVQNRLLKRPWFLVHASMLRLSDHFVKYIIAKQTHSHFRTPLLKHRLCTRLIS